MTTAPVTTRSSRQRIGVIALATVPTIVVLLVGLTHPTRLTEQSAEWWRNLHIILLPVFPFMGLAPWLVARAVDRRLGWVAAIGGFGFATCYTSLDVLAGIGGGAMMLGGESDASGPLFRIGNQLAQVGVYSLVGATLVASIAAIVRARLVAIPGALLALVGAYLIADGHVYFPQGTLALALVAGGYAILATLVTRPASAASRLE
ncbi:MAG: hypothetical protein RI885_57 [Actinomycetota bacterium]|jgi:hypothetical protein